MTPELELAYILFDTIWVEYGNWSGMGGYMLCCELWRSGRGTLWCVGRGQRGGGAHRQTVGWVGGVRRGDVAIPGALERSQISRT